jgi:hypothetical protein
MNREPAQLDAFACAPPDMDKLIREVRKQSVRFNAALAGRPRNGRHENIRFRGMNFEASVRQLLAAIEDGQL